MNRFLQKAMVRNATKEFFYVNAFLSIVTLISILSIAFETVVSLSNYAPIFKAIEYTAVLIFTIEYCARIYAKENKLRYIFSLFGIIDLVSIVPTYMGIFNLTFLKAARIARVLEFLRTIRLAKITRLPKHSNSNSKNVVEIQKISMRIYGLVLAFSVFIFGTLLYIIESTNPHFKDIPSGILWSTQALLGGDTDVGEVSIMARILIIGVQFTGLLLFGLLIHIVGKSLEKKLLGSKSIYK